MTAEFSGPGAMTSLPSALNPWCARILMLGTHAIKVNATLNASRPDSHGAIPRPGHDVPAVWAKGGARYCARMPAELRHLPAGLHVPDAGRVVAADTVVVADTSGNGVPGALIHAARGDDELAVGAERCAGDRAVVSGQFVEQLALQIPDSRGAVSADSDDFGT